MTEWPIVETVIFEGETRLKKTYENGTIAYELQGGSQEYIDNYIAPTRPKAAAQRAAEEHARKRCVRLNQLGDARVTDPTRIAEEDTVMDMITSAINTTELNHISARLEMFGDKTLAQLNQYFENNSTTTADFKQLVKKMYFALWGTLNVARILANRELPPEV